MVHLTILHFPVTGKITIPVKLVSTTCVAEIYTLLQTSRKMGRTKPCHHPPRPTLHHHLLPAKIHPSLPTTSQKMDHHPAKAKIYSYVTSFWHCFNSFFFFEMQYCFPSRRFCVTKFRSVRFSSSKFLLTFRSSHRRCSVRIGALRNFAIHRKTPVPESLFLIKLQA